MVIEPQPIFHKELGALAARHSAANDSLCRVDYVPAAAWKHDGNVTFSSHRDSRGAYVGAEKRSGQRGVHSLPSIDFGAYLRRTLRWDDLVYMKVDVETAEFSLLPFLLTAGALCNVDFLFVEWHFSKIAASQRLGGLGLRLGLAQILSKGCTPRPDGRVLFIEHDEMQLSRHHSVPGLWERSRWHNGNPPLLPNSTRMAWSQPGVIMRQEQQSTEATTRTAEPPGLSHPPPPSTASSSPRPPSPPPPNGQIVGSSKNGSRASAAAPSSDLGANCTALLQPDLHDAVPARAPLALLSALAGRIAQRSVVSIGDGATDGLACFALAGATSATAIPLEASDGECKHLQSRAGLRKHVFSIECADTLRTQTVPDADLYVWAQSSWRVMQWRLWIEKGVSTADCGRYFGNCEFDGYGRKNKRLNHVDSFDLLQMLRRQQLDGRVRGDAEVAMLFDENTDHDAWTLRKLEDMGWIQWNASSLVDDGEASMCLEHARRARSQNSRHVCGRAPGKRFTLAIGSLRSFRLEPPAHAAACTEPVGGPSFNYSSETELLRTEARVTPFESLSAALLPSGQPLCGADAEEALIEHLEPRAASRAASRAVDRQEAVGSPRRFAEVPAAGLFFVHAFRQVASEFAMSAHLLGMSSSKLLVRASSLLVVCTNPTIPTASLLRWLRWYTHFERPGSGLRMLIRTAANLGYSCGEFHSIAASVRVWMHFPWVICLSGPDVLAIPSEFDLLARLVSNVIRDDGPLESATDGIAAPGRSRRMPRTALLYDKFRTSRNDGASFREPRYNMDLFLFFPPQWLWKRKRATIGQMDPTSNYSMMTLSGSLWAKAAALCVRQVRNRPEAILHVLHQEQNMSFRLIGNGSRGTLLDMHKWQGAEPDAFVWHAHNAPAVLRWLQSSRAPPNAYRN
jgi:hypothetical protein